MWEKIKGLFSRRQVQQPRPIRPKGRMQNFESNGETTMTRQQALYDMYRRTAATTVEPRVRDAQKSLAKVRDRIQNGNLSKEQKARLRQHASTLLNIIKERRNATIHNYHLNDARRIGLELINNQYGSSKSFGSNGG